MASTREPTNTARRPNLVGSRGHTWIWVRRAQGRAARAEGQGQRLTGHSLGPGGHSPATSPGGSPPAPGAPCSRSHTRGSTVGDTSHLSASQDPYPRWSSQNVTLEGTLGTLFRFLPGDQGKQVQRDPGTDLLRVTRRGLQTLVVFTWNWTIPGLSPQGVEAWGPQDTHMEPQVWFLLCSARGCTCLSPAITLLPAWPQGLSCPSPGLCTSKATPGTGCRAMPTGFSRPRALFPGHSVSSPQA